MFTVVAGTNRRNSNTIRVAEIYCDLLAQSNVSARILSLASLPSDFIFSALYENQGKDPVFNLFREEIDVAKKIIFIIPEYNASFPGVLKAFIDGLSYPNALAGKKTALVGLSAGPLGGAIALSQFAEILSYLRAEVFSYKVRLPFVQEFLNADNANTKAQMRNMHKQLSEFTLY